MPCPDGAARHRRAFRGVCLGDPLASPLTATSVSLVLMWLLFQAVAIGVVAQFRDRIVAAIEARHDPAAESAGRNRRASGLHPPRGWRRGTRGGTIYLLLIVTGVGPLLLFLLVNPLALGRDLGEMVVARHLPSAGRQAWLAATRGQRALVGLAVTLLFMVPLVNLIAPVPGAAAAAHLFHARG